MAAGAARARHDDRVSTVQIEMFREALGDVLALVFPVACAGCGAWDVSLCTGCREELTGDPVSRRIADVPVWSALLFEGVAARVIRTLKEDGRTALARPLATAATGAIERVRAHAPADTLFVPVPSSRSAFRRRGFRPVELLMARASLPVSRSLRLTRMTADQRRLDVAARAANVSGAFHANRVAGRDVIVVDDVVTTGATLDEAITALRVAGATVRGAVTVAATPSRAVHSGSESDASGIPA